MVAVTAFGEQPARLPAIGDHVAATDAKGVGDIIVSDFRNCTPQDSLSMSMEQGKWQVVPYETDTVTGHMLTAASFINAPAVTRKLNMTGWHEISMGVWNPEFAYDGQPLVKVKLSGESVFRQVQVRKSPDTQSTTHLREVFVGEADLSGQDIVIAKSNGLLPRSAFVAYFRFRPLTAAQVAAIEEDRRRSTRNLVACIDGTSYFHSSEYSKPEHVRELVELYRHSDVGKVIWAATYGSTTNYPTKVPGAQFVGESSRTRLQMGIPGNSYLRGEHHMMLALRQFARQGLIPQQVAAEHAHSMGLKFELMHRLGILGGYGLWLTEDNFTRRHPQFRQVRRDGVIVEKASYAFPEVRELALSLVRESATKIDTDGINLCFVRGPHFLQFEEPIIRTFRERYDEDAREAPELDERLLQVRAEFMTKFVREAREVLDQVGRQKGKQLTLSVWVWPSKRNVWLGKTPLQEGLDVKEWIRQGLLDSVICQQGIDADYIELGREHHCKFILFTGYRGDLQMSPTTVRDAYHRGVESFAYWDIDAAQLFPDVWRWLRHIGHRDAIESWATGGLPKDSFLPLTKINGADAEYGLADAVYSGG